MLRHTAEATAQVSQSRECVRNWILPVALFQSVLQKIKSEQEPYRDPTTKELLQTLPATVGAAADAAHTAVQSAQHERPAQSPRAASPPPVSP
jgi:hypothetical protein